MGLQLPKRARNLAFGAVAGSAALFLSGCSAEGKSELERLAMPVPSSKESQAIYDLWQWAWLAAILTGIVVWALIFYVVIRYRRRDETEVPVQTRYNLPIEIFYTIAPIMMVIVFFYFTIEAQDKSLLVDDNPDTPPDNTVMVVGQQWSWTFNYVDAADGQTVYESGTPADPPTLWLVEDESVKFELSSPDVIHSFWVPAFLFKMDVVPGRDNHFTLTPNRAGTFEGRCAELCGLYHSKMLFQVKVTDQADFDRHMQELEEAGNIGPALGASEVTEQPGLEDETNGAAE